jgi:hypothetical protein
MEIFVEFGGDAVFHSPADGVTREASSQTFAKSGCALSVLAGPVGGLSDGRSADDFSYRPFADHRLFPVLSIRMLLTGSGSVSRTGEQ